MPFYDYSCRACGTSFDVQLSLSEYLQGPSQRCPQCGSEDLQRVYSPPGLPGLGMPSESEATPAPPATSHGKCASHGGATSRGGTCSPRKSSSSGELRVRDVIPGYRPGGGCGHPH